MTIGCFVVQINSMATELLLRDIDPCIRVLDLGSNAIGVSGFLAIAKALAPQPIAQVMVDTTHQPLYSVPRSHFLLSQPLIGC